MSVTSTKINKKMAEIMANLYLRHYSFADILDYINGKNILRIYDDRLKEHINNVDEDILKKSNLSKNQVLEIVTKKDAQGIAIIKFKINEIIKKEKRKQAIPEKEINIIKNLKNDMEEKQILLSRKKSKVQFSEEEKNNCMIYQMLNSVDYKVLKEIKLSQ